MVSRNKEIAMDWNDPEARLRLIERVGPTEYNRLLTEHQKKSVVGSCNGYDIRTVGSGFGTLFMVVGTDRAFGNLPDALEHCRTIPQKK
jgi:hypothetical protein